MSEGWVCGTGFGNFPKPGDPDSNVILKATPAFGGIDVEWTFPNINPHAVAHTLLFRSTSDVFSNAVRHAVVAGNFFYDKTTTETPIRYYYWIQIVSVNGTYSEVIGPATAIARPTIEQVIEELTGKIDAGVLAQSLKTEIAEIPAIKQDITQESQARLAGFESLGAMYDQLQGDVQTAKSILEQSLSDQRESNSSFVSNLNTLFSQVSQANETIAANQQANLSAINQLNMMVADLTSAPVWSSTSAYSLGNLVTHEGILYRALQAVPAGTAISNTVFWKRIGEYESISEVVSALVADVDSLTTKITNIDGKVTSQASRFSGLVASVFGSFAGDTDVYAGDAAYAGDVTLSSVVVENNRALSTRIDTTVASLGETNALVNQTRTAMATADNALAQQLNSLTAELGTVGARIDSESAARVTGDAALATRADALQAAVLDAKNTASMAAAAVTQEATTRSTQDTALASQINTVQAWAAGEFGATSTKITTESAARASGDAALSTRLDVLQASNDDAFSLIRAEEKARIDGDAAQASRTSSLIAGLYTPSAGDTDVYAGDAGVYAGNVSLTSMVAEKDFAQALRIDSTLVQMEEVAAALKVEQELNVTRDSARASDIATLRANMTSEIAGAIQTANQVSASGDAALASQINTVQSAFNSDLASVQTNFTTRIDAVNGKVTDIGALWTAKVDVNGLIGGFGVYNDGRIVEAGFDVDRFWVGRTTNKRKPFIIENNEVFIDQAAINELTFSKLRDESGSVVVENGRLKAQYVAVNSASIEDASITAAKIKDASIDSAKIKDASISTAKIQDASIVTAKIGHAQVDTLQIAGNAVSASAFVNATSLTVVIQGDVAQVHVVACVNFNATLNSGDTNRWVFLNVNGVEQASARCNLGGLSYSGNTLRGVLGSSTVAKVLPMYSGSNTITITSDAPIGSCTIQASILKR